MNLRPLLKAMIIVFTLSVYLGYWMAVNPFLVPMLHEAGHSYEEIGRFLVYLSIVNFVVVLGGEILNLVTSYYSGKQYKLTKTSTLTFLLLLIITVWAGNLIGYVIGQIQLPQYQILNINLFIQPLFYMQTPILWSFVGMSAGNYKREVDRKRRDPENPSTTFQ